MLVKMSLKEHHPIYKEITKKKIGDGAIQML